MVVEDGTGLANADALISVSYADDYHAARGNAWAGTETEKEQAIVKATDYMNVMLWAEGRLTDTQALFVPFEVSAFPDAIKRACAEYALRARSAVLEQDGAAGPTVVSETKQVADLQKSVTYSTAASQRNARRSYPAADRLIAPYLAARVNEVYV